MNVCCLVFRADSLTYTIVKAISIGGHDITVWVADPEYARASTSYIMPRLSRVPGVKVVIGTERDALTASIDRLLIQTFPRPLRLKSFEMLAPLAARTRNITLVTAGDRNCAWRTANQMQWQELRLLRRWLGRVDRVVYKNGFYPFDLFGAFKPRQVLGFDVHSMFLDDDKMLAHIERLDWEPGTPRPTLINFIGSQDPLVRKQILDSIRPLFNSPTQSAGSCLSLKNMVWHEYSDAEPAALDPMDFVDVLSGSDFTLCPLGYSLATHRVIEALLRGSVPILAADELDIYDIGLVDGVNCIAVPSGQWAAAVRRCLEMEECAIVTMRQNIRSLAENLLPFPVASRLMRHRLGLAA